jgi:hypothetical protein
MQSNLKKFESDLQGLVERGQLLLTAIKLEIGKERGELTEKAKQLLSEKPVDFQKIYQEWYSEASVVIKQILPERSSEFTYLYQGDLKRKTLDVVTYTIQDWVLGTRSGKTHLGDRRFDDGGAAFTRLRAQVSILSSAQARFKSSLFDIVQVVRADLFDSELDAARELVKHGFLRGAGAIAGVVIEKHLAQVCSNHNVTTRKQHPAISDFNDLLKNGQVIDVPVWRQIQRLGDIRNLCDHNKQRDPTEQEVIELIDGTDRLCKTLF